VGLVSAHAEHQGQWCEGASGSALGLGFHTFQATLFLSDGTSVSGGAVWMVLAD
jgi:hypothetical protein